MIENGNFLFSGVYRIAILNLKMNSNVRNPSFQVGHGNIISIDSSSSREIKNLKHDAHIMFTSRDECPQCKHFFAQKFFFVSNPEQEGASFHF